MDKMNKVVYVYLVFEKKDYFFGSIAAIYERGTGRSRLPYALECPVERDVGHTTSRAIIKVRRLLRACSGRK